MRVIHICMAPKVVNFVNSSFLNCNVDAVEITCVITDLDECLVLDHNPCVHGARCLNKSPGYKCVCPFGSFGDGTLLGSSCRKTYLLLEVLLGKLHFKFPLYYKQIIVIYIMAMHIFVGTGICSIVVLLCGCCYIRHSTNTN